MTTGQLYHLVKSAVSETEIQALLRYIASNQEADYRPNYRHTGIAIQDFYADAIPEIVPLKRVIRTCYETFTKNYLFNYNRFELKRLFGNTMTSGAVNEAHDDDGDVYPGKPEVEEHYSAILMLGDDYTGGELYFQHHDIEVRLEAGDLIMFRGNAENLHGVRQVLSGERVNVIIFFRNYQIESEIDGDDWQNLVSSWGV